MLWTKFRNAADEVSRAVKRTQGTKEKWYQKPGSFEPEQDDMGQGDTSEEECRGDGESP